MTNPGLPYDIAFAMVKEEIERAISSSPLIIRSYIGHLTASWGKMIRASALLTCAMDAQDLIHPDAVKGAASVEILHLATLVHDDVIDDADLRRGTPTIQKMFGKRTAVICGDYLLSVALKTAASVSDKDSYIHKNAPDFISRVCYGELGQHINNGNFDLSVYRYMKIISGKTAALFEASYYGGAVLSGAEGREALKYQHLGKYIGMIFQLIDDCMDFEATEQVAQKPVQSDFEKNVITLPLIHALRSIAGLKDKAKAGGIGKEEIHRSVISSSGIGFTRGVAKKYYDKYMKTLDQLELTEHKRNALVSVLNKAFRVF